MVTIHFFFFVATEIGAAFLFGISMQSERPNWLVLLVVVAMMVSMAMAAQRDLFSSGVIVSSAPGRLSRESWLREVPQFATVLPATAGYYAVHAWVLSLLLAGFGAFAAAWLLAKLLKGAAL